jgi:hypothetical protein
MLKQMRNWLLRVLAYLLSDAWANKLARWFSRRAVERIRERATDDLLETLLWAMDLCFILDRGYRQANLDGFSGRYVFMASTGTVGATAWFERGRMYRSERAQEHFTVRIRFKDAAALRRFLFVDSPDVLDALLANDIEIDGNLNYIYKFGFMVKDLERRLGLGS